MVIPAILAILAIFPSLGSGRNLDIRNRTHGNVVALTARQLA